MFATMPRMRVLEQDRDPGLRVGRRYLGPGQAGIRAALNAISIAIDDRFRSEGTDHRDVPAIFAQVNGKSGPTQATILRHVNLSRRSGLVFSGNDGLWLERSPIDRAIIPIATECGKCLPMHAIERPTGRTIQGKAGQTAWLVLVQAGGPASFIAAGDNVVINARPALAIIGAAPQARANDFQGDGAVRAVDNNAGNAARPGQFSTVIREPRQE